MDTAAYHTCSGSLMGNNKKPAENEVCKCLQHLIMTVNHSTRYSLFKNLFSSRIPSGSQSHTKGQAV